MSLSTVVLDKRIARLEKKLTDLEALRDQINQLKKAREILAQLESQFPKRQRSTPAKRKRR